MDDPDASIKTTGKHLASKLKKFILFIIHVVCARISIKKAMPVQSVMYFYNAMNTTGSFCFSTMAP